MTTTEMPRIPRTVPDWHEMGACQLFPELDFIDAKPNTPEALACRIICSACPVRDQCARDSLERGEPWGIWGGLDKRDRKELAAEFGFPPPAVLPEHGTNSRRVKWNCDCVDCKRAHAVYEADRRARARAKARRRGVWQSPLLVLVRPVRRARACPGQYLLPLDLPAPRQAEPEPIEPYLLAA